jgi:hypothetical protein
MLFLTTRTTARIHFHEDWMCYVGLFIYFVNMNYYFKMMLKKVIIDKLDVQYIIEVLNTHTHTHTHTHTSIYNVEMFNFVEMHAFDLSTKLPFNKRI